MCLFDFHFLYGDESWNDLGHFKLSIFSFVVLFFVLLLFFGLDPLNLELNVARGRIAMHTIVCVAF